MKKLITTLMMAIACCSLHAQTPSDCTVPVELRNHYERDVKHLALQRILDQQSPYADSIDIPAIYQDSIWSGMAAIFNATSMPQRDTVFDIRCIHETSNYTPLYDYLQVAVDLSYSWTHNWQNLNIVTGMPDLDTLLLTYGFRVSRFYDLVGFHIAELETDQYINMLPVKDSLEAFDGVNFCSLEYTGIDGNRLFYSLDGDEKTFHFKLAWGDCPSGCMSYSSYNFLVHDDCSVSNLGTTHLWWDPPPYPINCNITARVGNNPYLSQYEVFPNPAHDCITIAGNNMAACVYTLSNVLGQQLKAGTLSENTIHIGDLNNGLYVLTIKSVWENNTDVVKIVKQ